MSAADRMTVRTPDGKVQVVPRRVGLGMIARNQAKAERGARGATVPPRGVVQPALHPHTRPEALPEIKANRGRITFGPGPDVNAVNDAPTSLKTVQVDVTPVRVVIESVAPDGTAETVIDADSAPLVGAGVTDLPIEAPEVEQPKGNATRKTWADYAALHGVEVTDGMTRNMIRDAVVAKLESDRLSQPAFSEFEGGRLATPEDEPVTESAVTDADPGERTA